MMALPPHLDVPFKLLGAANDVVPTVRAEKMFHHDVLMLVTRGVWNAVAQRRLGELVRPTWIFEDRRFNVADLARDVVKAASRSPGAHNMTAIAVDHWD